MSVTPAHLLGACLPRPATCDVPVPPAPALWATRTAGDKIGTVPAPDAHLPGPCRGHAHCGMGTLARVGHGSLPGAPA